MKKIILSSVIVFLISGCADKTVILEPQNTYIPTFPTKDFNLSKKYKIKVWEEQEDVNGTTVKYLVADEKEALGFIKNTKKLRSHYNTLLEKLKKFNAQIIERNKNKNKNINKSKGSI